MLKIVANGIEVHCERVEEAVELMKLLGDGSAMRSRPTVDPPPRRAPKPTPRPVEVTRTLPPRASGVTKAGAPRTRAAKVDDDLIHQLHAQYMNGERSATLCQAHGISLAQLYNGFKRNGLEIKALRNRAEAS